MLERRDDVAVAGQSREGVSHWNIATRRKGIELSLTLPDGASTTIEMTSGEARNTGEALIRFAALGLATDDGKDVGQALVYLAMGR